MEVGWKWWHRVSRGQWKWWHRVSGWKWWHRVRRGQPHQCGCKASRWVQNGVKFGGQVRSGLSAEARLLLSGYSQGGGRAQLVRMYLEKMHNQKPAVVLKP